jgi:hypothetical protein
LPRAVGNCGYQPLDLAVDFFALFFEGCFLGAGFGRRFAPMADCRIEQLG